MTVSVILTIPHHTQCGQLTNAKSKAIGIKSLRTLQRVGKGALIGTVIVISIPFFLLWLIPAGSYRLYRRLRHRNA